MAEKLSVDEFLDKYTECPLDVESVANLVSMKVEDGQPVLALAKAYISALDDFVGELDKIGYEIG